MSNIKEYTPKPIAGTKSELLLNNPDRGLRLEVYMEAGTGHSIFEFAGQNAIDCLRQAAEKYAPESPKLAQVYFYLNHYWDRDLDKTAFKNMNAYFDVLEELDLKALLRFAYVYAEDKFDGKPIISGIEPMPEIIAGHLRQLKPFLQSRKHQIHVLQAGLIGVWGEWDFPSRDRMNADEKQYNGVAGETAVLNALLENSPPEMFLQVRYRNIKSSNLRPQDPAWNRVGFHDDYLVDNPHVWNTVGCVRGSYDWQKMAEESQHTLVDGEMIWGASNGPFHAGKEISAPAIARRLQEHHFTSLSLAHNYRERGGEYSMLHWQQQKINAKQLEENSLKYHPAWFLDESGKPASRSWYEYIRDYLGYYLVIEKAEAENIDGAVNVNVELQNYGFATPLGLDAIDVVILDETGTITQKAELCKKTELLPGKKIQCSVHIKTDLKEYTIGVSARNNAGMPVRFANKLEYKNGINYL